MSIEENCYNAALNLLLQHKHLTDEDFVKMLIAMDFPKEVVFKALNSLYENSLVEHRSGEFRLSV